MNFLDISDIPGADLLTDEERTAFQADFAAWDRLVGGGYLQGQDMHNVAQRLLATVRVAVGRAML